MGRAESQAYRHFCAIIISKYNNRPYISTFYEELLRRQNKYKLTYAKMPIFTSFSVAMCAIFEI